MTCIVGVAEAGKVWIGGDSAGVDGAFGRSVRADAKVFRTGPFVMGFTTSFRMGQLLRHRFVAPERGADEDVERYMVVKFIDAARKALRDGGWLSKHDERETGGDFLVGYDGELFQIESDHQVGRLARGYAAVGAGEDLALGALWTLRHRLPPARRIRAALEAAAEHNAAVAPPYHLEVLR